MRDLVIQFDHWLFLKINTQWTNAFLDVFFSTLTNLMKIEIFVKALLPLILIVLLVRLKKVAAKVLISIIITVGITDFVSYKVFKSAFNRARPHHTEIGAIVRVPYAPTSRSFPSNHAVNTFAIANVLTYYWPHIWPLYWAFGFLMSYSRVYVGVHYPLDIFAGMIIGIILAILVRNGLILRIKWFKKEVQK